jgi:hypothetical protein
VHKNILNSANIISVILFPAKSETLTENGSCGSVAIKSRDYDT